MKAEQAKIERDYNLAGQISRNLSTLRDALGIPDIIGCMQMTALLGIAHVPKKVLGLSAAGKRWDMISITQLKTSESWKSYQINKKKQVWKSKIYVSLIIALRHLFEIFPTLLPYIIHNLNGEITRMVLVITKLIFY